ncbi:MAG: DUF6293 family protein [Thermoplasmatota archaeon]
MGEGHRTVHIVPMGLELDRVLGGLKKYPSNRVILIYGTDLDSDIERRARENGERIMDMVRATIDVEIMEFDIFDFYTSTSKFTELFSELRENGWEVFVNISTGNRIVSYAAALSCFMTDAHPYYVIPESYSIPTDQQVLSQGVRDVMELPTVRIIGPSDREKILLRILGQSGGSVRHETALMPELENVRDFFPPMKIGESKKAHTARKRSYLSRLLKSMEKRGYLILTKKGKFVSVSLTRSGGLFCGLPLKNGS